MDKIKLGGIVQNPHLARISVLEVAERPGIAGKLLGALGEKNVNVQFIVHCVDLRGRGVITFCVADDDLDIALETTEKVRPHLEAEEITHQRNVALISIFGPDFRERPGIAGAMFNTLAKGGISILAISTSISTVSCLIDGDKLGDAVELLHDSFDLP